VSSFFIIVMCFFGHVVLFIWFQVLCVMVEIFLFVLFFYFKVGLERCLVDLSSYDWGKVRWVWRIGTRCLWVVFVMVFVIGFRIFGWVGELYLLVKMFFDLSCIYVVGFMKR